MSIRFAWIAAFSVLLSLASYVPATACEVCGCNMSNFNPELMLNSGSHSLGLFSQTRWYSARLHNHGPGEAGLGFSDYKELQSLFELRGTLYATKRLYFTVSLPLSHKFLAMEDETLEQRTGLGDVMVLGQYQILSEGKRLQAKGYQQRLIGGAGIKLPTGSFRSVGYEGTVSPHLQNGSGSVDFLFLAGYFVRMNKFALSTNANYKANTRNKDGFRFANGFNADLRAMYIHEVKKLTFAPSIGGRFEGSGSDMQEDGFYTLDTGGEVWFATAGLEVYYKNLSLSATYLQPIAFNLTGEQFQVKAGLQAGVKYSFAKKQTPITNQNL